MADRNYLVLGLAVLILASAVAEAEDQIEWELTADYVGKYIWRGQNLDDDNVFQTGLAASYKQLTVAIWGNLELTNINGNSGDFTELDYSLDYLGQLTKLLGYSVGVIYYDFPGTKTKDTTELYWGLNLDAPLSPSVTVYHDIDEAEGSYVSLGFAHAIEQIGEIAPGTPVGLELSASIGWGSRSYDKYYWGTAQSKLNDLTASAAFPIELAGWTVTPGVHYVTLLSDDLRDTDAYGTASDHFFVGIGLSKRF